MATRALAGAATKQTPDGASTGAVPVSRPLSTSPNEPLRESTQSLRAPESMTAVVVDGTRYDVSEEGVVTVDSRHADALALHGFRR
jgi:hypothetical protein